MKPLRIVVLEGACQQRQELVVCLLALAVERVEEAADCMTALQLCSIAPADMLLCGTPNDPENYSNLLRLLGNLMHAPAVALHGEQEGVSRFEAMCQRSGLRYFGWLASYAHNERLKRMLILLRDADRSSGQHGRGKP